METETQSSSRRASAPQDDARHNRVQYDADKARHRGVEITELLQQRLNGLPLDNNNRKDALLGQLATIRLQGDTPKTIIAFYGATGAGKSSLINAILGDSLMFTSGMQACTSVVTEISYKAGERLEASVEFLTQQEWEDEVHVLLADVQDADGREPTQEVEVARSKVKAVYPSVPSEELSRMTAAQLIAKDSAVKMLLGNTANIEAADSASLNQELLRYIDFRGRPFIRTGAAGSNVPDSMYWPLVKRVQIRVNCELLACGAALIDLPGIGDSNAARNSITQNYLRQADKVFIVAPITRVVSERTTNVLCSEAFRNQLEMDGKYNPDAVTFVVTKCDQIVYTETVRELPGVPFEENPNVKEVMARMEQADKDAASRKEELQRLETSQKDLESRILHATETDEIVPKQEPDNEELCLSNSMLDRSSGAPSQEQRYAPKRRRDCESVDTPPPKKLKDSEIASIANGRTPEPEVTMITREVADLETELMSVMRQFLSARRRLDMAEKRVQVAARELKVLCAKKRSEFSKEQLKSLFRASLDELEVCGLVEDRPPSDHRDVDLPVFTVSAHDYMRLNRGASVPIQDGEAVCFMNVEDTEIPELQEWIQSVTLSAREAAAEKLLRQLRDFVQTVQKWIDGIPGISPADRNALRVRWQSTRLVPAQHSDEVGEDDDGLIRRLRFGRVTGRALAGVDLSRAKRRAQYEARPRAIIPSLIKALEPVVDEIVKELGQYYSRTLEAACRRSAASAANELVKASEAFVRVGDGSIKILMHWTKYRATLRRKGDYVENLNDALAAPFIKRIARAWADTFRMRSLATLQKRVEAKLVRLLDEVHRSVPQYMQLRAEESLSFVLVTALEAVRDVEADVKKVLADNQRKIGRLLGPFVQEHLTEGYELANAERGKGMYQRQRDVFNQYLDSRKLVLFDNAANVLMAGLADATKAVGRVLDTCLEELAKKVEADVGVLWDVCPLEGEGHMNARLATKKVLTDINNDVDLLLGAKKARDDERSAASELGGSSASATATRKRS